MGYSAAEIDQMERDSEWYLAAWEERSKKEVERQRAGRWEERIWGISKRIVNLDTGCPDDMYWDDNNQRWRPHGEGH